MVKEMRCRHARKPINGGDVSTMVCPFSWVEFVKPKEYFSLLFEEKVRLEVQPKPCLLSRCKFFISSEGACKLMLSE